MTITFTDGSITSSASEQTIFDVSESEHFATWIFTHNMTSSDTIQIKVYSRDQNLGIVRVYLTVIKSGVQSNPAVFIPYIATTENKVTIQRTAGSDRTYSWLRAEVL